ncbi:MAG: alanine:cation symporter family protein [Lentimicrobiaceae bacterium]|nr:alanine:cation symporter family protein [Lentimicrobiaceae bacterium]
MKPFAIPLLVIVFLLMACSSFAQTDTLRPATESALTEQEVVDESRHLSQQINDFFVPVVNQMGKVLFWDPFSAVGIYDPVIRDEEGEVVTDRNGQPRRAPISLVVVWLILGAFFFTFFFKFINIRGFKHAIDIVRGVYDDPKSTGEVSHFQALATALSATVGLGNIAGVAIAVSVGGPGATFWMILAGLLGMASKFTECTLGVKYRRIDKEGHVSGGPMYYLRDGLKKRGLGGLGKVLALIFAILVIGGSFGGGNMFQANQSFAQLTYIIPALENQGAYYGMILAILVGVVIIGGIRSIANVTDKIVPFMAVFYVLSALAIIVMNIHRADEAFMLIINGAMNPGAIKGGVLGVLIIGFQRAAFSNEAGIGSAAIAHSAVRTERPITEGFVALLEPFIDTVVICTMTALVLIFTGVYTNPAGLGGSELTSQAFESVFSWYPYLLAIAIFLFAFSTMISWSYYGLKGFDYLFGGWSMKLFGNRKVTDTMYRVIFLGFIIVGASSELGAVMDFSDMMILAMAFPNILGLIILAPEVRQELRAYFADLKSGRLIRYK